MSALMTHNETLYQEAGQKILSGKIEINPIVVKHHAKGCQFCQFKSICGFESDSHLSSGRKVNLKSKEEIRASLLTGGKENAKNSVIKKSTCYSKLKLAKKCRKHLSK